MRRNGSRPPQADNVNAATAENSTATRPNPTRSSTLLSACVNDERETAGTRPGWLDVCAAEPCSVVLRSPSAAENDDCATNASASATANTTASIAIDGQPSRRPRNTLTTNHPSPNGSAAACHERQATSPTRRPTQPTWVPGGSLGAQLPATASMAGGPPDRLPPTADRGDAAPSPTNPARPSLVRAFVTPAWRRTRGGAGKQRLTAHRPSGINSRCGPWIPQGPHSRTRPPASGSRRPKW